MEDTNFERNNSFRLLNENINKNNEQSNVNIIEKLIIHLNDEKLEFSEKIKLKELRKMIEDIIEKLKNFKFKKNEKIYNEKEEENFTIEDIIEKKNPNELSIHLTKIKLKRSNSQLSKNDAKKNVSYKKENNNNINYNNFIKKIDNLEIKTYKNEPKFNDKELSNSKTIIMVGETGSGKTTMINSLTNYLSDVKLNDNYRYLLINEAETKDNKDNSHSQTSDVNIYYIRSKKKGTPNLRIIDTPGYGDTRGYEYDKKITKMIKDKFEKEIKIINSICFVAKSDKIRLSFEQNYVFYEVLSLFGKNIADNFIFLFTFCDNKEPLIINSLKENEPFKSFISKINEPWYLKFNNSGFFGNPNYDQFVKFFFDIGKESFNQFFKKLKTLNNKKVNISQILSDEKEIDINNLEVQVKELLKKIYKISILKKFIEKNLIKFKKICNNQFDINYQYDNIYNLPDDFVEIFCKNCNQVCLKNVQKDYKFKCQKNDCNNKHNHISKNNINIDVLKIKDTVNLIKEIYFPDEYPSLELLLKDLKLEIKKIEIEALEQYEELYCMKNRRSLQNNFNFNDFYKSLLKKISDEKNTGDEPGNKYSYSLNEIKCLIINKFKKNKNIFDKNDYKIYKNQIKNEKKKIGEKELFSEKILEKCDIF